MTQQKKTDRPADPHKQRDGYTKSLKRRGREKDRRGRHGKAQDTHYIKSQSGYRLWKASWYLDMTAALR